jgi:hypothetical protein
MKAASRFRQMKGPQVVSFGPVQHRTDPRMAVLVFYCVLALSIAHPVRPAPGSTRPYANYWRP